MNDPRLLRLANLYQVASAGVLALVMFFVSRDRTIAVLCGGLLMAANFYSLRVLIKKTLQPGGMRALYAVGLMLKFFAIMGIMALCLITLKLDAIGFMIGLCTLLTGTAIAFAHQSISIRPRETAPSGS